MTEPRRVAGVESGRKLLQVLFSFSESRPIWTVAELADSLSMPQAMVYRYIALLREQRLLDTAGVKSYRLTERVLSLADAATAAGPPIAETAMPLMTQLRDDLDETILLSRRSGWFGYCIERVESRQPVRLQYERGAAMSLHLGSMSRVLLSAMSKSDRDAYFEHVASEFPDDRPPVLQDSALDAVAASGFTESFGEIDDGIWGIAASIVVKGKTVASLGTAAPLFRSDHRKRDAMTSAIVTAAAQISQLLEQRAT